MKSEFFVTEYDVNAEKSFALDDNIMVKGGLTTAGSKMLYNFISPLEATVAKKLKDAGMELVGKTTLDELAVPGITTQTSDILSGAVGAVSKGICKIALCNDVSGKIRRQAPGKGLYYIHPTYGTVSRFGLIPTVSSMDQIGIVCKNVDEGFEALATIAGRDENDVTTYAQDVYSYAPREGRLKIGIPSNVIKLADEKNRKSIYEFVRNNYTEEFELKYFDVFSQIMYILSSAEIGNNTSRYDGVKFGYRTGNYTDLNTLYTNTRAEGFELDLKLASIVGAFVLSKEYYETYYLKSMKIRRLIKEHADEIFKLYDAIALPLKLNDTDPYANSALYAFATLCGLPSVSLPLGYESGIQLVAQVNNENSLYGVCKGGK